MPKATGNQGHGSLLRSGLHRLVLAGLVLLGLIFWAVLLPLAEGSVFSRVPILDEVYYLDRARTPEAYEGYFVSPLYPRLIALAGSGLESEDLLAEGGDLRGIRILQILCWLGTVVLLRLIAGRLYGGMGDERWRTVAVWLPPLLFAFYLPASVYTLTILLEIPQVFLVTLAAWLALRLNEGRGWIVALALGLVLGLAGLLRGTMLVLLPLGMLVASLAGPRRFVPPALVMAAALVVLLPASLHNSRAAGRPAGPTLNGGVNLAIGNNPVANGFYVALVPGDWRSDPAGTAYLAAREGREKVSLGEADDMWRRQGQDWMREHPGRTAALWAKKMWLHVQAWEIDQLTPLGGWTSTVPLMKILVAPYGLFVVLGITGFAAGFRDRRLWLVAGALLLIMAAQSLFFVVSRYRLVLAPFWLLAAGAAVAPLMQRDKRAIVAAALAILLVIPWGLSPVRDYFERQAAANAAGRWSKVWAETGDRGAEAQAGELFRFATAEGEASPAAWLGLSAYHNGRGERVEAEKALVKGWMYWPARTEIGKRLVALRLNTGNGEGALETALQVLEQDPHDADTLHNAIILLADRGRIDEALDHADRLIAAHPKDARGYNDRGIILARTGDAAGARETFQRGLAAVPGHPGLTQNLDRIQQTSK